ncbi:MAG: hypothetical protein Q4B68_10265 [Bacteroidales bacterium]|nr:hypothetical protein [Bacteroidales bacterium]
MLSDKAKQKAQYIMLSLAMLLLVGTAVLPLLNVYWEPAKWIYAFGAVLALAERLTERYQGSNLRIRRLYMMGKISALLYCISAYLLIFSPTGKTTDWLAFLMAGAVMQTYCMLVYDHVAKKEQQGKKQK